MQKSREDILKPGSLWQHFKGNKYRIVCVAKHSESLVEMVVYEALYENPEGKYWVRPKVMFLEKMTREGKTFFRYEPIKEEK